jgi:hypothetical protein
MVKNSPILGTAEFPIVLQPHFQSDVANKYYWPRELIKGTQVNQKYEAIEKDTEVSFSFTNNVIKNSFLNAFEIRLALYFYQKQILDDGVLYLIGSSYTKNSLKKVIGDDDLLHITDSSVQYMLLDEVVELMTDLKVSNILESTDDVVIAIERLIGFGYLTVTEICWDNVLTRASRNVLKKKVNEKDIKTVYAHNIRILPIMDNRRVYKTFKTQTT